MTSFKINWLDLLAVQGSLKSLLQLELEGFSSLALCLLYGPTLASIRDYWKDRSLDYCTFVGKVMSVLFNTLSRFVIALLPRSKHLLILWL